MMLFPFNCAEFLDNSKNDKLRLRFEVTKRLSSYGHNSYSDKQKDNLANNSSDMKILRFFTFISHCSYS
jgi:hypothetical protein